MPGLRWSELEYPIRVSSLLGIVSGGSGIIALGFLAVPEAYYVQIVLASLLPLLLIPLLTGLSLLFFKLTNEQRGVMGFVCFVSSLFIMVADYFLLFFAYWLHSLTIASLPLGAAPSNLSLPLVLVAIAFVNLYVVYRRHRPPSP